MKVFLGCDHGGFPLKQKLLPLLKAHNIFYEDCGTFSEASCDYPQFAAAVSKKVQADVHHRGVLICTSGVGMCIAANKFKHVYAACLTTPESVIKARQHNGINVLCLPGSLNPEDTYRSIQAFLDTDIDPSERHQRRRQQIIDIEKFYSNFLNID